MVIWEFIMTAFHGRQASPVDEGTEQTRTAKSGRGPSAARVARFAVLGGMVGALGAASCCIAPLVLFSLGIGGAWIGNLAALAPYQPYFVAPTLVLLCIGFVIVYRKPKAIEGAICAQTTLGRVTKPALWAATALISAALAFPYVAPRLLGV